METTIKVSDKVKENLDQMKVFDRESYNDVIKTLIEDQTEINDETKEEIEKARNEKNISHKEVKNRLGL